ncbi:MAG: site-specific DNA-methyltransferase [Bacteroidetes bacterium]|nr:site-specific DNA-methyltransferase [Bacteroidota bacterium]
MAHEKLKPNFVFDEEKIEKLKQLAPECFEDGKINFETLKQNLGEWSEEEDESLEHFGLFWPGKKLARKAATIPPEGTLEPVFGDGLKPDGTSDEDGKNPSKNIFIEGENLEVLKLLQKSYADKIKMIYIDPPYNTGNDFVYDDDFTEPLQEYLRRTRQVDEEGKSLTTNKRSDGRFHSKWLSMMYPRLRLARNLLKDDGVIFISIGDNEVANLKVLMHEIFGEENFISELVWRNGRTSAAHFTNEHEYILVYGKNKEYLPYFMYSGDGMVSDRAIKKPGPKNPLSEIFFPSGIDFESDDIIFPNKFGDKEPCEVIEGVFEAKNGKLASDVTIRAAWSMADQIRQFIEGKEVFDQKGQRLKRFYFKSNGVLQYEKFKGTVHPKSVIVDYSYKNSSSSMQSLLGENPFDFTKPVELLNHLFSPVLTCENPEENIILDFFAGSGSTGHSILELNKKLNWNNKYILVQLPEPIARDNKEQKVAHDFCLTNNLPLKISEITKIRLKKCYEKLNLNSGFKTLKLTNSNFKKWSDYKGQDVTQLTAQFEEEANSPFVQDWNKNKLFTEILLLEGFPLDAQVEELKIGENEFKRVTSELVSNELLICLDEKIGATLISELKIDHIASFICLDNAISNQDKLRLSDKGLIKTI